MGMTTHSPATYQKWYEANKALQVQRVRQRVRDLTVWLREYKQTLSCVRCSEAHPACLDFHHRDPAVKDIEISRMTGRGWGKKRMLEEIAKCDVLCANCHRKEHARLRSVAGDAPDL